MMGENASVGRVSTFLVVGCVWLFLWPVARADIFRWDNGQLILGTEGITPGPGVQLDHRELEFALLELIDLMGANFEASNLTSARLGLSSLANANFASANLTSASLDNSALGNANLSSANLSARLLVARH